MRITNKNIFTILLILLLGSNVFATKRYWRGTGANSNWNNTFNWSATSGGVTNVSVPVSTDSAYFDTLGNNACTINAAASVKYFNIASNYHSTITQSASITLTVGTSGMVMSGGTFTGSAAAITDNGVFTLSGMNFTSTSGILTIFGNYTRSSGKFIHNNGSVKFTPASALTLNGNTNFYDLTFNTATYTITSGNIDTCQHNLTTTGSSLVIINTGTIFVKGDITMSNTSTSTTTGGTATITINGTGSQTINGAAATLRGRLCNVKIDKSSGTLTLKNYVTIGGDWTYLQGTIDARTNSSTVVFPYSTGRTISGNDSLYNVSFHGSAGATCTTSITSTDTLTVNGTLTTEGNNIVSINDGVLRVKGNVTANNTSAGSAETGGDATILFSGNANQTFTGASTYGAGKFCNVKIKKTGGTLTLSSKVSMGGGWVWVSGTVDSRTNSSTVAFCNAAATRTISGNNDSLYNVRFYATANDINTITSGDTLIVNGELRTEGTYPVTINTGVINARGNIVENNTYNVLTTGGTGTILISGAADQLFSGSQTGIGDGRLCNIKIKKTGGTLTLDNFINVSGDWIYNSGRIDASSDTSTVVFANAAGRTISGTHKLYNVLFYAPSTNATTITSTDTLKVAGLLSNSGSGQIVTSSGYIAARGDITINNSHVSSGGSVIILIDSTNNQIFTGNTSAVGGIGHIKICKPSGTLTLKKTIVSNGNWIDSLGTVIADTTSTVVFPDNSSARTISGKHTLYNVTFDGGTTGSTNTIPSTDTITVAKELKFIGSHLVTINAGTINAKGDINDLNTTSISGGGSANINICGAGRQTLTGPGIALRGVLPNVYVNKSIGTDTLHLVSIFSSASTSKWKYIQGIVDPGTSAYYPIGGADINCGTSPSMSFYDFRIQNGSTVVTLSGPLNVKHLFWIDPARGLTTNSHDVTVGGNWNNGGTYTQGTNKTIFNGTAKQYFTAPAGTQTFYDVVINKPSEKLYYGTVTSISITHSLTMTKGVVAGNSSHLISMADNATSTGGWDSSYISGPMKKIGDDTFVYPLGDTTLSSGAYHPLTISAAPTLSATDAFTAQYYAVNQTYGSTLETDSLSAISNCEYWVLTTNTGTHHPKPYLGWNTNSCNVDNCHLFRVAGYTGTRWESMGNEGVVVSGSMGTVKGHVSKSYTSLPLVIAYPVNPSLAPTVTVSANVSICNGASTSLTAGGATTYSWAPSTGLSATTGSTVTASPATTITYTVTGTNTLGCTDTATVTVTVNPLPTVTVTSNSSICLGDSKGLTASGASTYSWSPSTGLSATTGSSVTASPTTTITYTVTGTNSYGCTNTASVTITVNSLPTVTVSANDTICPGESKSLTASGASTYVWSPSTGLSATTGATVTATPSSTITYSVIGTNASGCKDTATVTVTVGSSLTVSVSPSGSICISDSTTLTASGALTYSWSPSEGLSSTTGASVTTFPSTIITYTVTGTNAYGCTDTATIRVARPYSYWMANTVMATCDDTCNGKATLVHGPEPAIAHSYTFDWLPGTLVGDSTTKVSQLCTGDYTCVITDNYGCVDSLPVHVGFITRCVACYDCIGSFAPTPGKKYLLSAWTQENAAAPTKTSYTYPTITISCPSVSFTSSAFGPTGEIIDGWQRIEGEFTIPDSATDMNLTLSSSSGDCYFDDIRVFPFDGSMKSYVYDPITMRLVAELDERNYATKYEYDEEGRLVRVKKETEKGFMTIKESRNNTQK